MAAKRHKGRKGEPEVGNLNDECGMGVGKISRFHRGFGN
jgi:hypothetical protein